MNRQHALKVYQEIPWNQLRYYKTGIGMVALSEEQIEAVSFALTFLQMTPEPFDNSTDVVSDEPFKRYDNGAYTQDNG